MTSLPFLVRLDGGHDALDNRILLDEDNQTDFIIKWNPRKQDVEAWLAYAGQHGVWTTPREGKRVALFSVTEQSSRNGKTYSCRRVMQITERTMTPQGQLLLMSDIELEGWWTSLPTADSPATL